MSNTYNNRNNIYADAGASKFSTGSNTFSGNNQPYGSVTINQTQYGYMDANAQAAIDDIAVMAQSNINSVVINTDGISPQGIPQTDLFKFSGVVLSEGKQTGEDTLVNFYGFKIKAVVGDTAVDFTNKIVEQLKTAVSKKIVIKNVIKSSSTLVAIEITYLDNQPHSLSTYTSQGITITPSVLSPNKPGVGSWSLLGTTNVQLDGQKAPIKLYYFTRTS